MYFGIFENYPHCVEMIPCGDKIFRLVTDTYTKNTISKFQVEDSCGVSSMTTFMIVDPKKFI